MMETIENTAPFFYRFGGAVVESWVNISLLPNAKKSAHRYPSKITFKISDRPVLSDGELVHTWPGRYGLSLYRLSDAWVFNSPTGIQFKADTNGSAITCFASTHGWSAVAIELLVRRILPRVILLQNRQVLHGAALATPHQGILLFGQSHAGKSTLAASLSQIPGWVLLDDDTAVLTEQLKDGNSSFDIHSAAARACLWADSREALSASIVRAETLTVYDGKYRCEMPSNHEVECQQLRAIYHLAPCQDDGKSSAITIESLSAQEAATLLVKHQVRFNPTDAAAEAKRLASLARLVSTVPVRALTYPRVYGRLPEVCERIGEDLSSLSPKSN